MEYGPDEEEPESPALPPELRVKVPRSSLRYLLLHRLKFRYGFAKKKPAFSDPVKRHLRIRKFMIEMDRALRMQDAEYLEGKLEIRGEFVIVFTDETYIHSTHAPLTSWLDDSGYVSKSAKGKRLVILNAITMADFVVDRDESGFPIEENSLGKSARALDKDPRPTAEWIWEANAKVEDYHKNMDGDGFEKWLENRLVPAFEKLFPDKKMILVMDNAAYHHQINPGFYPKGKTPLTSTKGLNARVLRMVGCTEIIVKREGEVERAFSVPVAEPAEWASFLDGRAAQGSKAPATGEAGTVYGRFPLGPSSKELAIAATRWYRANAPQVLNSKVEEAFRARGWKIIWTPPYCPKYQPIELVWGVGKQRAGCLYFRKRDLATTKQHLRVGWYGGTVGRRTFLPCNVWGCWQNALTEMQSWVDKDLKFTPLVGLSGTLGSGLMNVGSWTSSEESCLDIKDMGTDDDELFEEEERVGGAQVVQAAQEDIQVAAAHVGGGNDGAEPGDEAVHGVEVAVMADA